MATLDRGRLVGSATHDALIGAVQRLSAATSVQEIRAEATRSARRLARADGATLLLRSGEDCCYVEESAVAPLWKGKRFPMHTCVGGWVMRNRTPVMIEDIEGDSRVRSEMYRSTFARSLAMVPVRRGEPMGAIGAYWAARHRVRPAEMAALQALADSTAVALESVWAHEELDQARREVLDRLALAAEYRDNGTRAHTARVARTALALSRAIGLPEDEASLIGQAAPLHDVGKLAVPDAILLKPGRLTEAEFSQIKTHTTAGAAILAGSASDVLQRAEEIALTHHEQWDGSGYPSGLRGESIPMSGRIVALADVFDALTHDRPYKSAWPAAAATAEIQRLRNRQFDPAVVDAFLELEPRRLLEPNELSREFGTGP